MTKILVSSPFPLDSSQGNAVSALRLEKFLKELGFETRAIAGHAGSGNHADVLVALNAWRSADVVQSFRRDHPDGKVIVQITGSDLYSADINTPGSPSWRSLEFADAIAIFHTGALTDLPAAFHSKTFLTPNSVDVDKLPERRWSLDHCKCKTCGNPYDDLNPGYFPISMIGNLRPVKAPEVLMEALAKLPETTNIHAHAYGEPDDATMSKLAEQPRFHLWGRVSWQEAITAMLEHCILVNTSIFEGGSNAVCEAMTLGVPILASKVPGNVGLLGEDHGGLYPQGDAAALARLLTECEADPGKLLKLSEQSKQRALLFTPEREKQGWKQLLKQLIA